MQDPRLIETKPGLPGSAGLDPTAQPTTHVFHARAVDFLLSSGQISAEKASLLLFEPAVAFLHADSLKEIHAACPNNVVETYRLVKQLHAADIPIPMIAEHIKRYGDGFVSLYHDLYEGDGTKLNFAEFEAFELQYRNYLTAATNAFLEEASPLGSPLHEQEIWAGFRIHDIESDPDLFATIVTHHGSGASSLYRAWGDEIGTNEPIERTFLRSAANLSLSTRKDSLAALCRQLPSPHRDELLTILLATSKDSTMILEALPVEGFARDPMKYVEIVERFKGYSTIIFKWYGRDCERLGEQDLTRLEKLFGSSELSSMEEAPINGWSDLRLGDSPSQRRAALGRLETLIGECGPHFEAFAKLFGNSVLTFFDAHGKEAKSLVRALEAADLDDEMPAIVAGYPWGDKPAKTERFRRIVLSSGFSSAETLAAVSQASHTKLTFAERLVGSIQGHAVPFLKTFTPDFITRQPALALRTAELVSPHGGKVASAIPQKEIVHDPERFAEFLDMYGNAAWGLIAQFQTDLFSKEEELRPLLHEYCALTRDGAGEFFYRVPQKLWDSPEMRGLAARYAHATGAEYGSRHADFSYAREDELWERHFLPAREILNAYYFNRYCLVTEKGVDTSLLDSLVQNHSSDERRDSDSAAITLSAYDHNGAFSGETNYYRLRELDHRFRLLLREVQNAEEVAEHFEQSELKHGRKHRLGIITAHGFETGVSCRMPLIAGAVPYSTALPGDRLTTGNEDILTRTGRTVRTGGDFILACCLSARGGYGAENLLTKFKSLAPHLHFFGTRIATYVGPIRFDEILDRNRVIEVSFGGPHRKRVMA